MAKWWQGITPWQEEKGETFWSELAERFEEPKQEIRPTAIAGWGGEFGRGEGFFPAGGWEGYGYGGGVPAPPTPPPRPRTEYDPTLDRLWQETQENLAAAQGKGLTQADLWLMPEYQAWLRQQEEFANRELAQRLAIAQMQYGPQQAAQEAQWRQAQLGWQREQWGQQLAAEKEQRLAQLAAQPISWLEYAALSGQAPAIQPWMLPLMPQEYSQLQAGGAIPGWGKTSATGMPALTTPSAQYSARMGPTAQQQYYGYEQARTAAQPTEQQFRMWNIAPPGQSMALTQRR